MLLPLFGLFKVTSIIITVPVMTCLIVYLWLSEMECSKCRLVYMKWDILIGIL